MQANVNVPHCSAGDNSIVSLVIAQAGQKDQGLYYCSIQNSYGKATAEFHLTTEGKPQLFHFQGEPLAPASSEHLYSLKAFSSVSSSSARTTFKPPGY